MATAGLEVTYDDKVLCLSDSFLQLLAQPREEGQLRFDEVRTPEQWSQVKQFRLEQYKKRLPYMLQELGRDGSDSTDERSCIFAVSWNGKVIATIRLTPHPFETSRYVPDENMARFLGTNWRSEYLEWSRLLIDAEAPVRRLTLSVLVFAGLRVLSMTPYRCFFAYVVTARRSLFRRFLLTAAAETFVIPTRGDHHYTLLKGSFLESLDHVIKRLQVPARATLVS